MVVTNIKQSRIRRLAHTIQVIDHRVQTLSKRVEDVLDRRYQSSPSRRMDGERTSSIVNNSIPLMDQTTQTDLDHTFYELEVEQHHFQYDDQDPLSLEDCSQPPLIIPTPKQLIDVEDIDDVDKPEPIPSTYYPEQPDTKEQQHLFVEPLQNESEENPQSLLRASQESFLPPLRDPMPEEMSPIALSRGGEEPPKSDALSIIDALAKQALDELRAAKEKEVEEERIKFAHQQLPTKLDFTEDAMSPDQKRSPTMAATYDVVVCADEPESIIAVGKGVHLDPEQEEKEERTVLSPGALQRQLLAEVELQETLAESRLHLAEIERQRQLAEAQATLEAQRVSNELQAASRHHSLELAAQQAAYEAALNDLLVAKQVTAQETESAKKKKDDEQLFAQDKVDESYADATFEEDDEEEIDSQISVVSPEIDEEEAEIMNEVLGLHSYEEKLEIDTATFEQQTNSPVVKEDILTSSNAASFEEVTEDFDEKLVNVQEVSAVKEESVSYEATFETEEETAAEIYETPNNVLASAAEMALSKVNLGIMRSDASGALDTLRAGLQARASATRRAQVEAQASIQKATDERERLAAERLVLEAEHELRKVQLAEVRINEIESLAPDVVDVPQELPAILQGSRIEAQFNRGDTWFPGVVTKIRENGAFVDIDFDDGDTNLALPARFVRVLAPPIARPVPELTEPPLPPTPDEWTDTICIHNTINDESLNRGEDESIPEATQDDEQDTKNSYESDTFEDEVAMSIESQRKIATNASVSHLDQLDDTELCRLETSAEDHRRRVGELRQSLKDRGQHLARLEATDRRDALINLERELTAELKRTEDRIASVKRRMKETANVVPETERPRLLEDVSDYVETAESIKKEPITCLDYSENADDVSEEKVMEWKPQIEHLTDYIETAERPSISEWLGGTMVDAEQECLDAHSFASDDDELLEVSCPELPKIEDNALLSEKSDQDELAVPCNDSRAQRVLSNDISSEAVDDDSFASAADLDRNIVEEEDNEEATALALTYLLEAKRCAAAERIVSGLRKLHSRRMLLHMQSLHMKKSDTYDWELADAVDEKETIKEQRVQDKGDEDKSWLSKSSDKYQWEVAEAAISVETPRTDVEIIGTEDSYRWEIADKAEPKLDDSSRWEVKSNGTTTFYWESAAKVDSPLVREAMFDDSKEDSYLWEIAEKNIESCGSKADRKDSYDRVSSCDDNDDDNAMNYWESAKDAAMILDQGEENDNNEDSYLWETAEQLNKVNTKFEGTQSIETLQSDLESDLLSPATETAVEYELNERIRRQKFALEYGDGVLSFPPELSISPAVSPPNSRQPVSLPLTPRASSDSLGGVDPNAPTPVACHDVLPRIFQQQVPFPQIDYNDEHHEDLEKDRPREHLIAERRKENDSSTTHLLDYDYIESAFSFINNDEIERNEENESSTARILDYDYIETAISFLDTSEKSALRLDYIEDAAAPDTTNKEEDFNDGEIQINEDAELISEKLLRCLLQESVREAVLTVSPTPSEYISAPSPGEVSQVFEDETQEEDDLYDLEDVSTQKTTKSMYAASAPPACGFSEAARRADWRASVERYANWLTSDSICSRFALAVEAAAAHRQLVLKNNDDAVDDDGLLDLFIDLEHELPIEILRDINLPHGCSDEDAQIHRHAVFDALADDALIAVSQRDPRPILPAVLARRFKRPGDRQPHSTSLLLRDAAKKVVLLQQSPNLNLSVDPLDVRFSFYLYFQLFFYLQAGIPTETNIRFRERQLCFDVADRIFNTLLRDAIDAVTLATTPHFS